MNWNFRVVDITHENDGDPLIAVREVYYDEADKMIGYCEPCTVADDIEGMTWLIEQFNHALTLPVIDGKTLEERTTNESRGG